MTNGLIQGWLIVSEQWFRVMMLWSLQACLLLGLILLLVRGDRFAPAAKRYQLWLLGIIAMSVLPAWTAAVGSLDLRRPAVESLYYVSISAVSHPIEPRVSPADPSSDAAGLNVSRRQVGLGVLFIAWVLGISGCFLRFWISRWRMRQWVRSSRDLAAPRCDLPIRFSTSVQTPLLAGLMRPEILLPADIEEWTTEEQRATMILHELAHFHRRDHIVNVFQALIGAVFFFHPVVRYALRQLNVERELACDDRVLDRGADPKVYAQAILRVAQRSIERRLSHQLALTTKQILERRLSMILTGRPRSSAQAQTVLVIAKAALIVALTSWVLLPQRELKAASAEHSNAAVQEEITVATVEPALPALVKRTALPVAVIIQVPVAAVQTPAPAMSGLTGKIYDPSGSVLPGVTVNISSPTAQWSAVTGTDGAFAFPMLEPATYKMEASLPGFVRYQQEFTLLAGREEQNNLMMPLAPVSTWLTVTVQKPQRVIPEPSGPKLIGGDVRQASLIFQPKPVYPATMRAAGIQGVVVIEAVIAADGTVVAPRVTNADVHPDMAREALDSVRRWRYRPATLNGIPIETATTVAVSFSMVD